MELRAHRERRCHSAVESLEWFIGKKNAGHCHTGGNDGGGRNAMKTDPILKELHEIRRELLKQSGGTLEKFAASLRRREREHPARLVGPKDIRRKRKPASAV